MRRLYAWLLLAISTFQWIGGYICFEVVYSQEIEVVMTESEEAISNDIAEETGIETSVDILPEGEHMRVGADYGNYFAYSLTDSTGTVFYTIDYSPRTVTWEQVAGDPPKENEEDGKAALLKHLFSEFLFPSDEILKKHQDIDLAMVNFRTAILNGNLSLAPVSPPPDFFC